MNVQTEQLGELHEKITITIDPADYQPAFNKSLKELAKKANFKGFRPGHVPMGMVKKLYGDQALAEELNKLVNEAIDNQLKSENKQLLGDPLPAEDEPVTIHHGEAKEYVFQYEVGIQPQFELGISQSDTFTWYKIPAGDDDIQQEVERLRKKYGKREEVDSADDQDVIYVHLQELDATGENPVHVHTFYNREMLTEAGMELLGSVAKDFKGTCDDIFSLFKGEKEQVAKNVLQVKDADTAIIEGIQPKFEIAVERIVRLMPADNDAAFFEAASGEYGEVADMESLEANIRAAIEHYNNEMTKGRLDNDIYKALVESTSIALPEQFLDKWYAKNRAGNAEGESADTEQEPLDVFLKRLKESLIFSHIQKEHELTANQEEVIQEAIAHTRASYGQLGEEFVRYIVENNIKDRSFVESMHDRVLQNKFLDIIRGKVNIVDEAITLEAFQNLQKATTNVE